MLILGVDSASTRSGFALLENRKAKKIDIYDSPKKLTLPERLAHFQVEVATYFPCDLVVIERVSKKRNLNTVRMLAYFEAAVMLKSAEWDIPVLQLSPNSARKLALKNGRLKKDQVYYLNSKKYKLLPYDKGGADQSDALTLALAGLNDSKK